MPSTAGGCLVVPPCLHRFARLRPGHCSAEMRSIVHTRQESGLLCMLASQEISGRVVVALHATKDRPKRRLAKHLQCARRDPPAVFRDQKGQQPKTFSGLNSCQTRLETGERI